jgi:two-component system sensor histidine kinase PhoQ
MDNAYKYGHQRVELRCERSPGAIEIVLDDDGAGWPEGQVAQLTQRGHRADQIRAGQGIGLAVVQELVSLYEGELTFSASSLGGGRVSVRLPQRV